MATRLRGHHIESIDFFKNLSLEEYAMEIVSRGYVPNADHPFVAESYNRMQQLLRNPESLILLVAGEKDLICDICPSEPDCILVHAKKSSKYTGSAFANDDVIKGHIDRRVARRYGFEISKDMKSVTAITITSRF